MGIEIPDLDDREFDELVEHARRQIPVHTDAWTDHNAQDTGIAILELLAWLSDTYTYQLNSISAADREKYLSLLGVSRRPPQAASTAVAVDAPPELGGTTIPAGRHLEVEDGSGEPKRFATDRALELTAARIERVVTDADDDTVNNTRESESPETRFYPFGDDPGRGDALYLGFDADPFADGSRLTLNVDYYEAGLPEPATHGSYESTFEPSVSLVWEHCTDYANWRDAAVWTEVPVLDDETTGFYQGGTVVLEEPSSWNADADVIDSVELQHQPPGLVWLRCRIERPGYEVPPQLDAIRANVVDVSHRRRVESELLTRADGSVETTIESGQTYHFEHAPVLEATVSVAGEQWSEVDDFDTSDPTDRHYILDNSTGTVTFGNGLDGTKPPVGSRVVADRYVHGGGTAGNVSVHAEWQFAERDGVAPVESLSVAAIGPATGGTDQESVDDALERFNRDRRIPYRAATLEDYEYVACHTPGLRFGRTLATRESVRGDDGTVVSVSVLPHSDAVKPEPSEGFLGAVERHLDRCRLLTDRVRVRKPTYVHVGVSVTVTALPEYTAAGLTRAVEEAIADYIHPVTGYDGDGWPFGRPLYAAAVEDVVEAVAGVKSVSELSLTSGGVTEQDDYGNVHIPETALLALSNRDLSVTVASESGRRTR